MKLKTVERDGDREQLKRLLNLAEALSKGAYKKLKTVGPNVNNNAEAIVPSGKPPKEA